jgi:hypothetical protein
MLVIRVEIEQLVSRTKKQTGKISGCIFTLPNFNHRYIGETQFSDGLPARFRIRSRSAL